MISVPSLGDTAIQFAAAGFAENFPYWEQLHPWCVVRQLPEMQRVVLARFRKRNQAEDHLKVLRRLRPGSYAIVFDVGTQPEVTD